MFPSDSSKHRKKTSPVHSQGVGLVLWHGVYMFLHYIQLLHNKIPVYLLSHTLSWKCWCPTGTVPSSTKWVFGLWLDVNVSSRWTNRKTLNQHWRPANVEIVHLTPSAIHTFNMLLWKQPKVTQCKCVYLREDIIFRRKVVKVAKLYNVNRG